MKLEVLLMMEERVLSMALVAVETVVLVMLVMVLRVRLKLSGAAQEKV